MHTPGSCLALTCITFFCACLHVFKGVVDATQVPWNIYSMEDAESSMIVQLYTRHVVLVPKCSNTPKCWYESQKKIYNIFSLTLLALYHRQAASSSTTAMSILHLLRDCIKRAAPTEDDNQSLQRHSDPSLQCRFFITKQLGYLHLTAVKS